MLSNHLRFNRLTEQLLNHESLWRASVFQNPQPNWQNSHPTLYKRLLSLNERELHLLESSPEDLYAFLNQTIPDYTELLNAIQLPNKQNSIATPKFAEVGIPGRKWQQIQAFLASIQFADAGLNQSELVDWCAGKSHLGRTAAMLTGAKLWAIEYDNALCHEGKIKAEKAAVNARFTCADVLKEDFIFTSRHQILALHACGDLHRKLLQSWQASDSEKLILAPCCYEKWLKDDYTPLSRTAQQRDLQLNIAQVKLAMQETVTASSRERNSLHKLQTARLCFDLIQREIRAIDSYLETPSLPLSAANWPIEQIIATLAEKKALVVPDNIDIPGYLLRASERYQQIRRLQLAAQGFRRALELWLVTDLALYLEENGHNVTLQEFCARSLSPRNIQLIACKALS